MRAREVRGRVSTRTAWQCWAAAAAGAGGLTLGGLAGLGLNAARLVADLVVAVLREGGGAGEEGRAFGQWQGRDEQLWERQTGWGACACAGALGLGGRARKRGRLGRGWRWAGTGALPGRADPQVPPAHSTTHRALDAGHDDHVVEGAGRLGLGVVALEHIALLHRHAARLLKLGAALQDLRAGGSGKKRSGGRWGPVSADSKA